jgi:lysyl endopeptidase
MNIKTLLLSLILLSGLALAGDRPAPASWSMDRDATADLASIPLERFGALDLEALALDDADREAMGEPPRFAWPHATAFSIDRHGSWDHHADTGIWRIRVHAENANLLNFGFANVHLPPGSRLYIYSPKAALDRHMDRYQVIGPYGHSINHDHGEFWTPNLHGNEAIVEINVPADSRAQLGFEIIQVSHGYRGFGEAALGYRQSSDRADGDGKQICRDEGGVRSGACNQDVACLSEDDPWNDPRQAVGAYQRSGSFACTGSLVNNTAQDQRMLFMTATHCIVESQAPSIVVYWNYEWPTCRRPGAAGGTDTNPPDPNMSHSGGTWLAATVNPFGGGGCTDGSQCSDVTLIELNQPADPDFNLFWAGWDRRPPPTVCAQGPDNSTAGLCATIHHPGVDEKRITWVEQDIQVGNIAAATGVHWHPFWHPNPPELPNMPPPPPDPIPPAVTEGGSSGSPLYSADRRLLGVLSGGPAFCGATGSSLSDFYGGLFHAWDGLGTPTTRMRDHLDPLGSEPLFIDGTGRDGFSLQPDPADISQCGFGDIVIDIEVGQLGEFDDPVTLSTDGLPAGVTDDFSINPVTPPGSSTLTLSNLAAAGPGPFSFILDGESGDFDQSVNISVFLADDSPQPATITSPANGAIGVSTSPTIIWTSDLGVNFELEIATDAAFDTVVYSATVSETSHQVSDTLDSSTVYYVRVRAANDCGTADWSPTISFTTAALPGDCPVGTVASDLLFENFDGGSLPAGWSTAGSSGTVTWVPTTAQTHSGSHSIFAQNIASVSDQRLATPAINLPNNAVSLFMNWENWQEVESGGATGCYDGGLLEISTSGGATWTPVEDQITVRDYDGTINTGFSNPLAGLPAWCGDPRAFWERYTVSLADWAGQDVQFRFRFGTDSSVSRIGWYVDSVNVRACFPAGSSHSVGGTVSGLDGSGLVLQNNGGDDLAISENGSFEFATTLFDGQSYDVSVAVHPSAPAQVCQVINGSGTVDGEDVTDVEVVCELAEFSIGGTVSGLSGSGLVLQNNGGDDLAILANGSFEFATELTDGESYDVTVASQPGTPAQTCNVNNASGTVNAADVSDIEVVCEDQVTTLTGLISSLGYCQDDPSALGGALVAVNGQNQAYSMATGSNGLYQFQLPADESPISITVSHSNHRSASLSGLELDEELIEQDFGLVLRESCARTDQESVGFSLVSGSQSQQMLVLSNALGGIDLSWSLDSDPGCYAPGEPGWLGLSHTGGLIAWGNQRVITLDVDTAGLAEGQYGTSLCFATSDPDNAAIEVEVLLEVLGPLLFHDRFEAPPED